MTSSSCCRVYWKMGMEQEWVVYLILSLIFLQRGLKREARTHWAPTAVSCTLLTRFIAIAMFPDGRGWIFPKSFFKYIDQGNLLESKNTIEHRAIPQSLWRLVVPCWLPLWLLPSFPPICHTPPPAPEILQPEAALVSGNRRQKVCSARPALSNHTSSLGKWIFSGSAI